MDDIIDGSADFAKTLDTTILAHSIVFGELLGSGSEFAIFGPDLILFWLGRCLSEAVLSIFDSASFCSWSLLSTPCWSMATMTGF